MTADRPVIVRVSRRFRASAERVFDAWLDPERARRWLFATPSGEMVRAEIDPRVGGSFTFVDRRDGQDVTHAGRYVEIDRPRRLVFSFGVPDVSADFDLIEIDIVAVEDGCELTLTHEMKPDWAAYAGRTESGWAMILDGLARSLDGGNCPA
jgi:uncharacterized protein YndB with AHSA1/START domain